MRQMPYPRARLSGLLTAAALVVTAARQRGYRPRHARPTIWTRDMFPDRRPPEP